MNKRDIKFRAWVEADNSKSTSLDQMVYFEPLECDNGMWFNTPDNVYHINEYHSLMQFTGLQDKYGVDIYEGDILNNKEVVVFSLEQACYFTGSVPLCMSASHREVIGNIHENQELLKQR